jgi:hypothetical protein
VSSVGSVEKLIKHHLGTADAQVVDDVKSPYQGRQVFNTAKKIFASSAAF